MKKEQKKAEVHVCVCVCKRINQGYIKAKLLLKHYFLNQKPLTITYQLSIIYYLHMYLSMYLSIIYASIYLSSLSL